MLPSEQLAFFFFFKLLSTFCVCKILGGAGRVRADRSEAETKEKEVWLNVWRIEGRAGGC